MSYENLRVYGMERMDYLFGEDSLLLIASLPPFFAETASRRILLNVRRKLNTARGVPSPQGRSPRKITGVYRNSWSRVESPKGRFFVFSNHDGAARLEYGFVGFDSIGRYYNQPPYPHLRPAIDSAFERMKKDVAEIAARVIPPAGGSPAPSGKSKSSGFSRGRPEFNEKGQKANYYWQDKAKEDPSFYRGLGFSKDD